MLRQPHIAALTALLIIAGSAVTPSITRLQASPSQQQIDENRRLGRPAQALYHVEVQASIEGWTPELARQAGDLRRELGDLAGAVAAWELIPEPDVSLLRELARGQMTLERWGDAVDSLKQIIAQTPSDEWAQLNLGLILAAYTPAEAQTALTIAAQEGAYAPLAEAVMATLTTYADDELLSMRVGAALVDQREWNFAELAFTYAAQVFEPFPEALAYRGLARAMQGKDGRADVLRAVALAPDEAVVRYVQGVYLRAVGDEAGALDALAQAIALAPQNAAYYAELAQAYRDQHNLQQAEHWLLTALDVSGNDPRYQALLAQFYADEAENLTASGISALENVLGMLPDDPSLRAGYGWALYVAGDTDRGRTLIDDVLSDDPNNPRALYYHARILLDSGVQTEAISELEQVAGGRSEFATQARALLDNITGG